MPDSPISAPEEASHRPTPAEEGNNLILRMLYDEQARLRAELEAVRSQQDGGKQHPGKDGSAEGEKYKGGDQDKGGDQGKGDNKDKKEGDKDNKGDENGDNKGDEKGKEKTEGDKDKKPPLTQRVGGWIKGHPLTTMLILIGLVLLVVAVFWLFHYLGKYEETDDAFVEGHTDPISARINGFVTAVYVENTYRVKKGQLLLQLDPRDYQVAKEQAAAQLGQAQANIQVQQPNVPITATTQATQVVSAQQDVASAEANISGAEARFGAALSDLREAEANEANAAREEERYKQLVLKEEVSRETYDSRATQERAQAAVVVSRRRTAEADAKQVTQAQASLLQAQARLKQAQVNLPRQIAAQRATLAERQAAAKQSVANADQAELNLEYTRIYAPEDGIIGDRSVQLNSQVTAGQELFALTQTNDIWVTANFKETEITNMHPGQSVRIHVDALKLDFEGYVEALPGGSGAIYSLLPPENATGNYVKVVQRLPVRIRFKPGQPGADRLAPGMSVEPKVWVK